MLTFMELCTNNLFGIIDMNCGKCLKDITDERLRHNMNLTICEECIEKEQLLKAKKLIERGCPYCVEEGVEGVLEVRWEASNLWCIRCGEMLDY